MLVQSIDHFYVRKGDLQENYGSAMRSAVKKLAKLAPTQEFQGVKEPNWDKSPISRSSTVEDTENLENETDMTTDDLVETSSFARLAHQTRMRLSSSRL